MKKWVWFALLAILIFSLFIRLSPLSKYAIWGSDTGEYYFLSKYLAEEGVMVEDYDGWGFGYPYFPGMFFLTVTVSQLTGLNLFYTMIILIPTLSGLSIIFIYLLTRRLGGSEKAGLIAAAFLGVAMPHVLTTSHPMPGTIGDVLALLCIFLLLQSYKNYKFIPLLIIASIALIITHHLSTFIFLIALISITSFRELLKKPKTAKTRVIFDLSFIFIFLCLILAYWFIYAVPFREGIISINIGRLNLFHIVALVYLGFIALIGIVYLARKYMKYEYKPPVYPRSRQTVLLATMVISGIIVILLSVSFPIPPLKTTPDSALVYYILPFFLLFSIGILGASESEQREEGTFLIAWVLAISISIGASILVGSHEIVLYRQFQYIVAPWAIFVGLGVISAYNLFLEDADSNDARLSENSKPSLRAWIFVFFISALIICSGALAYPPKTVISGFEEGITDSEMAGVIWCRGNLESGATVATDHRMSSMLFGFAGLNASWDTVEKTFYEDNFEDIKDELESSVLPSGKKRIDYVMISDEIKEGVALSQYEAAEPIPPEALEKFKKNPFYKIYDSGSVQVYMVDWNYA